MRNSFRWSAGRGPTVSIDSVSHSPRDWITPSFSDNGHNYYPSDAGDSSGLLQGKCSDRLCNHRSRQELPQCLSTEMSGRVELLREFPRFFSFSRRRMWRSISFGGAGSTGNRLRPSTWVWAFPGICLTLKSYSSRGLLTSGGGVPTLSSLS